jgi:hypothetical protein
MSNTYCPGFNIYNVNGVEIEADNMDHAVWTYRNREGASIVTSSFLVGVNPRKLEWEAARKRN